MKVSWQATPSPVYERMKLTRARFKYAQRSVGKNQDTLRAESLASKLDTGDGKTYWKEVKFINTGSTPLSNKVGETSGGNKHCRYVEGQL